MQTCLLYQNVGSLERNLVYVASDEVDFGMISMLALLIAVHLPLLGSVGKRRMIGNLVLVAVRLDRVETAWVLAHLLFIFVILNRPLKIKGLTLRFLVLSESGSLARFHFNIIYLQS